MQTNQGGFNLGGINASGQIPDFTTHVGLVDPDTPKSVYTRPSYVDPNKQMVLVFSDEFNEDGRTFYPGDDAYWEAIDLHYWGTVSINPRVDCLRLMPFFQNDLEWYDPIQGRLFAFGFFLIHNGALFFHHPATTGGGSLLLRIDKVDNLENNHNLQYRSGMVSPNQFVNTLH